MAQSIGLFVEGKLTPDVRAAVAGSVTPKYLKGALRRLSLPNRRYGDGLGAQTTYEMAQPYEHGIPTEDGSLKEMDFGYWSNATGAPQSDRLVIAAIALRKVQRTLAKHNVKSRMHFEDVDERNYARLARLGLLKTKEDATAYSQ